MGVLVVIIIIGVIVYIFSGRKRNTQGYSQGPDDSQQNNYPAKGVNNCPADTLINSRYYDRYKTVFDLVWYKGGQPQYKMDWLIESLDKGRELEEEGHYVWQSAEEDLPYFCETEREYDLFHDREKAVLRGSLNGIFEMISLYGWDAGHKHESKCKYWTEMVRLFALEGNKEAQAAICSNQGMMYLPPELITYGENNYKNALFKEAEEGDARAQLAVGAWLCGNNYSESIEWLKKAAAKGLTDAYYYLAKQIKSDFFARTEMRPDWNSKEGKRVLSEVAACFLRGAECANGVMTIYCQWYSAINLEDGSNGFEDNVEKSIYWYKKAAEGGDEYSFRHLEYLQKRH